MLCFGVLLFSACNVSGEKDTVPLIEGVPSFEQLSDSLNKAELLVAKSVWQNGVYQGTKSLVIDWKNELAPFISSDVNQARFKDAFSTSDTIVAGLRKVTFTALKSAQEIKSLEITSDKGNVRSVRLLKERKNSVALSRQEMLFIPGVRYSIDIQQKVKGVFENQERIEGRIIKDGHLWRGHFQLNDGAPLPFLFNLSEDNRMLTVFNAEEVVPFALIEDRGDTSVFQSKYFDTRLELVLSDSTLSGNWVNERSDRIRITPISGRRDVGYRFPRTQLDANPKNIGGEWMTIFNDSKGNPSDTAIFIINQQQDLLTASLLTTTGDYRFLEGAIIGDSMLLSSFDGSHAYLFAAAIGEGTLAGVYKTAPSYATTWTATPNRGYTLADPESAVQPIADATVQFSFPDAKGKRISLSDDRFSGKAVIVSIMGSWCSNCMDEMRFLNRVYQDFSRSDLEIVALDFEMVSDSAKARAAIVRYQQNMNIDFPMLLAGLRLTKAEAAAALPFLSELEAYPTLVLLDKSHQIVHVHSGFSGPGTGAYYQAFVSDFYEKLNQVTQ